MRSLPLIAVLLGVAGVLPFLGLSLGAVSMQGDWATRCQLGLLAYGAVILAFLGGVHWGIGLEQGATQSVGAARARFGLGVLPALVGWVALLVAMVGLPTIGLPAAGLLILVLGFTAAAVVESRGVRAGLVPTGYMALRWILTTVVLICLVAVLLVLVMGGRVIL